MATIIKNINELIEDIKIGKINIPYFQRDYKWGTKQIIDLMDSFNKDFPIGTITLWENSERESISENSFLNYLFNQQANGKQYYLLIDGQQRITTLSVLRNIVVAEEFIKNNRGTAFAKSLLKLINNIKKIYVVFNLYDGENEVIKMDFTNKVSSPSEHYIPIPIYELFKLCYYELSYNSKYSTQTFNELEEFRKELKEKYSNFQLGSKTESNFNVLPMWQSFFSKIYSNEINIIPIASKHDIDDVIEIYTRINRAGKSLTSYDINKAEYGKIGIQDIDEYFDSIATSYCSENKKELNPKKEYLEKALRFSFDPKLLIGKMKVSMIDKELDSKANIEKFKKHSLDFKYIAQYSLSFIKNEMNIFDYNKLVSSYTLLSLVCKMFKELVWEPSDEEFKRNFKDSIDKSLDEGKQIDKCKLFETEQNIKNIKIYFLYSIVESRNSSNVISNLCYDYETMKSNPGALLTNNLEDAFDIYLNDHSHEQLLKYTGNNEWTDRLFKVSKYLYNHVNYDHSKRSRVNQKLEEHHFFPKKAYEEEYGIIEEKYSISNNHSIFTVPIEKNLNNKISDKKITNYLNDVSIFDDLKNKDLFLSNSNEILETLRKSNEFLETGESTELIYLFIKDLSKNLMSYLKNKYIK